MRSNTRRYITSRGKRSVGYVSRFVIDPAVLQKTQPVSPVIENKKTEEPKHEVKEEIVAPVTIKVAEVKPEIVEPVAIKAEVVETKEPDVKEPETEIVEVEQENKAEQEEPVKKESAYAKRKKAKENKK